MDDWIRMGDRSHPNLKQIDKLRREINYDGHEKDLAELEEAHFEGNSGMFSFDDILNRILEADKMSRGDRSHPNLVRLDALIRTVSYDGWRDDLLEAEQSHLKFPDLIEIFKLKLKKIERKQKISVGDRSDAYVKNLDSLRLSYPNWRKDWQQAFDTYIEGKEVRYRTFAMQEKQRMHEGDRSHPRLVALDSLQLTYAGWEEDAKEFERKHTSMMDNFEVIGDYTKEIESMRCKQSSYEFGLNAFAWMKPDQRTIVETQWTFPGCEEKVELVRKSTSECFDDKLEGFRVCQMIHDGDFSSHPLLIKLNSMDLTYPGWEDDVDKCKSATTLSCCWFWKFALEKNMKRMQNKQRAYDAYIKSCREKERSKPRAKNEETALKECVVCWEATRSHVFVPCGHLAACKSCSDKIMVGRRKICPVCNQVATMAMEVFHP